MEAATFPETSTGCPICGLSVVIDIGPSVFGCCFVHECRWYSTEEITLPPPARRSVRDQAEDLRIVEPIRALPLR